MELAGSTAFITGGAQGIGLGIARALAAEGVSLALADLDEAALSRARDALPGARVETYVLDVRDRDAFARVADEVEAQLGPVSLLFNNAGVAGGCHVSQMTYEQWDWLLGINLGGVVNGVQTFVPRMLGRGAGYVVNTSSGAGLVATDAGFLYTTAKYAVVGMSETLAMELAPFGIGVSVLCPGPVATDIVQNTWKVSPNGGPDIDPAVEEALQPAIAFLQAGTSPETVGQQVLEGIRRNQVHIFTDDLLRPMLEERAKALIDDLPVRA